MGNIIKRVDVLRDMDLRETSDIQNRYFSIQFYKKDGEMVTLTRARSCGLRQSQHNRRMRGVQQVDDAGNAIGHVYPISIDNIREFNGNKVNI